MIVPSTTRWQPFSPCWPWLVIGILALPSNAFAVDQPLSARRAEADTNLQAALEKLATRCDELKLPQQAAQTRAWHVSRRQDQQVLFLPSSQDLLKPAANASQIVGFWYEQLTRHRQQHARELFSLVEPLLVSNRPGQAYQLLFEILRDDPTHTQAARILGISRETMRKPRATLGRTRHARLGWAARSYWTVRSPHYEILTNHSAQAGLELARHLEQLQTVWQQVFFRYEDQAAILKSRFAGNSQPWIKHQLHHVVLFRDRPQYVNYFAKTEPQIGMTTGYYQPGEKTAYFYAAKPALVATWYHEGTHQLFQERGQSIDKPGEQQNFWAIEGVALYMESLQLQEGYCTLGGFESSRLQYARYDKYINQAYLPLKKLLLLGQAELQEHPEIRSLYRQSAGLAHFLMTGEQGRYRTAFIDYLRELYRGSDQEATLPARTGKASAEVDQQYHEFLMVRDRDLLALNKTFPLRKLVLGHTQVTNKGFLQLGKQPLVTWLDLTATRIDEEGMVELNNWVGLERISLEGTRITGQLVTRLARLPNLSELDLSATEITDESLKQLGQLTKLRVLWLTGTRITDAGLPHLEKLQQLEVLNLDQTQVSDAARQRLQEKLPKLKRSP
ncbi:MAG: DUF1570 domain-containing protein [Pirellulaceae bacterium]